VARKRLSAELFLQEMSTLVGRMEATVCHQDKQMLADTSYKQVIKIFHSTVRLNIEFFY